MSVYDKGADLQSSSFWICVLVGCMPNHLIRSSVLYNIDRLSCQLAQKIRGQSLRGILFAGAIGGYSRLASHIHHPLAILDGHRCRRVLKQVR